LVRRREKAEMLMLKNLEGGAGKKRSMSNAGESSTKDKLRKKRGSSRGNWGYAKSAGGMRGKAFLRKGIEKKISRRKALSDKDEKKNQIAWRHKNYEERAPLEGR